MQIVSLAKFMLYFWEQSEVTTLFPYREIIIIVHATPIFVTIIIMHT